MGWPQFFVADNDIFSSPILPTMKNLLSYKHHVVHKIKI